MRTSWFVTTQSIIFALILHVLVLFLLLISFSFKPELRLVKPVSIVNAVTVDKARVDAELKRLQQEEEKKRNAEKQRIEELEKKLEAEQKKADEIKKQRLEEEKKLLATRQKKEEEQQKQEEAQKKLAELEEQRKLEEEKKARTEAEKKRLEEEKKKNEAELKKKEEEKKRQVAEKALQEQMEAEERLAQETADRELAATLGNEIHDKIAGFFNLAGLPENLSCKLRVNLLPSGEVVGVSILESSGNDIFDRRALTAVQKASPLPVPQDVETFERLNLRESTFIFKP
ncbi:MAG: cell envelope integrity protein TolA [Gammaproteobacteria bacterium]